jgi:hypothetical protein
MTVGVFYCRTIFTVQLAIPIPKLSGIDGKPILAVAVAVVVMLGATMREFNSYRSVCSGGLCLGRPCSSAQTCFHIVWKIF